MKELISKGRMRGFLTETEILHLFANAEDYLYEYEIFLSALDSAGIQVIEDTGRIWIWLIP
jgi:hypothetical protein